MPHGGTAIVREYEAAAAQARSAEEHRELSAQYVEKHRQEILTKLERARLQANRRKVEADRAQAEVDRLREILALLASELDARAPRLARADLEEFRAILRRGLTTAAQPDAGGSPGASPRGSPRPASPRVVFSPRSKSMSEIPAPSDAPSGGFSFRSLSPPLVDHNPWTGGFAVGVGVAKMANGHGTGGLDGAVSARSLGADFAAAAGASQEKLKAADTVHRLRARIEQLEKSQARLKKENDQLRAERIFCQDLPSPPSQPLKRSPGAGPCNGRVAQAASGLRATSPQARAPRRSAAGGLSGGRMNTTADEASSSHQPSERERLLGVIRRLEKEQAEQQQYADQVVNELGVALRALETENSSLQAELRQGGRKAGAEAEIRKRLERQVRSLETERDALTREVVRWRSSSADTGAPDVASAQGFPDAIAAAVADAVTVAASPLTRSSRRSVGSAGS